MKKQDYLNLMDWIYGSESAQKMTLLADGRIVRSKTKIPSRQLRKSWKSARQLPRQR